MFRDQFSEPRPRAELAQQDQATVRNDAGTLEIDLQGSIQRELKGLFLYFTHSVSASGTLSQRSNPHED